ncbi:ParB/RepB/Spo0J family partition protein [Phenylobacterium sp. VNQ135]|uniref:ParB/RepB/Spo0J family partition protein n=1 Tax=Phenylobacterium sp. VNQ135 TaxID=3400922 RepID=UPI003C105C36
MSKNRGFAAGLAGALDSEAPAAEQPQGRLGIGVLAGRSNRLAELASGAVVARPVELVDPARCRIWAEHNRDYERLDEARCSDLIESLKAQGRQEIPAIVRRVKDDSGFDLEVICGARRHWTVSWLRAHNYPEFRFLVEIREMTDEEAFRVSDLENRTRDDLSDIERARDYLRALDRHYQGRQKTMAQRLNVSEAWLSRYLDLARLPPDVVAAFPDPHALRIKHITFLKPLLKPDAQRGRVLEAARALASRGDQRLSPQDVIRRLKDAAEPPRPSGAPKKSGSPPESLVRNAAGKPILRIDAQKRQEVRLTLMPRGGATREQAETALRDLLTRYWPPEPI